jgi:hypothetical protein
MLEPPTACSTAVLEVLVAAPVLVSSLRSSWMIAPA